MLECWCFGTRSAAGNDGAAADASPKEAFLESKGPTHTVFQPLQLNKFRTQQLKRFVGGFICSSVLGLHTDSIIAKNRWWRIELYADVGGGVRFGCGEGGEHLLIPLELVYEKLQRTISFALRFRFNSLLQRWKALSELHNLAYFNIYHMLRCMVIVTASAVSFDVHF